MQRGYDALQNPVGIALIIASLLIIIAISAWGSFYFKGRMNKDKETRAKYREALQLQKDQASGKTD